jgi:hypothetical protein
MILIVHNKHTHNCHFNFVVEGPFIHEFEKGYLAANELASLESQAS